MAEPELSDGELLEQARNIFNHGVTGARPERPQPVVEEPKHLPQEAVVEKVLGGYILPDKAVDLSAWLRDGLEVYNLFVQMKPLFFQMLEALGGEFTMSQIKANKEQLAWRVHISERDVLRPDGTYDRLTTAKLTPATGLTQEYAGLGPLQVPAKGQSEQ